MIVYFTWFIGSCALGALGTWLARELALRKGWLDRPNERSFHERPTPRIGGIGLLLPLLVTIPLLFPVSGSPLDLCWILLLLPALCVAVLSAFDDGFGLSRLVRFSGHTLCALLAIWLFREVWRSAPLPLFGELLPPILCAALLIIWITGLTNSYNFMDGIDGISALQGLVAVFGWLSVYLFESTVVTGAGFGQILLLLALGGGLLGYLVLNWPPASIFMGDAGSTFLGFYLASLPFGAALLGVPFDRALEAGVFFVWPFIIDAAVTFLVRAVRRENVFDAHRSHLYQTLAATFRTRNQGHRVTSLLYGLLAMLGVGLYWTSGPLWAKLGVLAWIWIALAAWTYGIRLPAVKSTSGSTESKSPPDSSPSENSGTSFMPFDIYLSPPEITETERRCVLEALASGFIAPVGPQLTAFEKELAYYLKLPEIQAVSSGTAAIHLGLRAIGVGPGDYVLSPDLTFIASVNPIRYLGAEPVLVDVDPANWAIDPGLVKEAIQTFKKEGRIVRAIVVVHAFGIPAPIEALMDIAREEGVAVLEDCAGAFGSQFGGKSVGSFGDAAAFSFNGNKVLTTSGGGGLFIRDPEMRSAARRWANQGRDPSAVGYAYDTLGYNYKLSNISAAIGLGQLETVSNRLSRKAAIFKGYQNYFSNVADVTFMPKPDYGTNNFWLSSMGVENRVHAAEIVSSLRAQGIEAAPMWKPMHLQPLNKDLRCFGGAVSERVFQTHFSLPSGSGLTQDQMDRVCSAVHEQLLAFQT